MNAQWICKAGALSVIRREQGFREGGPGGPGDANESVNESVNGRENEIIDVD